jgi:RNase P subunit RPR2
MPTRWDTKTGDQRRKIVEQSSEWKRQRPDLTAARNREYHLRHRYGISMRQRDDLLNDQQGRCKACGDVLAPSRHVHVDHDHRTGRIRGILCHSCNGALGHAQDDSTRLRSLADYMDDWNRMQARDPG